MEELLDQLEMIFRARGLTAAHGRIFGALLLSRKGLTQKELSGITTYSIPAVSLALDDLMKLGLVKSQKIKGKREKVYTITGNLVKMFRTFLKNLKDRNVAPLLISIKTIDKVSPTPGLKKLEKEVSRLDRYLERLLNVDVGE